VIVRSKPTLTGLCFVGERVVFPPALRMEFRGLQLQGPSQGHCRAHLSKIVFKVAVVWFLVFDIWFLIFGLWRSFGFSHACALSFHVNCSPSSQAQGAAAPA
jgi:hypothetical protein